jgi:DNA primase
MLPEGEDPDSYVRAHGSAGFRALLDSAKPSIEFKLDPQIDRLNTGFESPSAIARKAEALIRELTPREEWDRWRVYVAGRLKVNVDDLRNSRFLANSANFAPRAFGQSAAVGSRHAAVHHRSAGSGRLEPLSFEREVLSIILEDPPLASEYADRILPERFRNELYRRTYERIVQQADGLRDTADVFAAFAGDGDVVELLASLGQTDRSKAVRYGGDRDERRAHLDRIVERLKRDEEQDRYAYLSRTLDELFETGKPVPRDLMDEFEAVKLKLKK